MAPKKKTPAPQHTPPAAPIVDFLVKFDEHAITDLDQISDQATVAAIIRRAQELKQEPMKQGKALADALKGYRSVRAAGQRYRIVYRVFEQAGDVVIVVVGIRMDGNKKDAYEVAEKRLS